METFFFVLVSTPAAAFVRVVLNGTDFSGRLLCTVLKIRNKDRSGCLLFLALLKNMQRLQNLEPDRFDLQCN